MRSCIVFVSTSLTQPSSAIFINCNSICHGAACAAQQGIHGSSVILDRLSTPLRGAVHRAQQLCLSCRDRSPSLEASPPNRPHTNRKTHRAGALDASLYEPRDRG